MKLPVSASTTALGDGCNNWVDFVDQDGNWVEELEKPLWDVRSP